jgi:hypothetical protein
MADLSQIPEKLPCKGAINRRIEGNVMMETVMMEMVVVMVTVCDGGRV